MNSVATDMNVHMDEAEVRDYFSLLKPRVMTLVIFTGICALLVAPGDLHPFLACVTIFCLAIGAGAAGAINMWYDRDIDAVMKRTSSRPIPAGKVPPAEALTFGIVLSLFAVMVLGLAVNWVAAFWLAFANIFYSVVYTMWLKRSTAQNIVIGGAAGAFPPIIAWAAVTGTTPVEAWVLFAIIFFWTPPHFWALALFACKDYEKVGIPMLPVVKGERHTKWQMLGYTILLAVIATLPGVLGFAGFGYTIAATVLNLLFIISAVQVLQEEEGQYRAAKRMFGYSIFYLFALFAVLVMF